MENTEINSELKEMCFARWKKDFPTDTRLEKARECFDDWIKQIPDDKRPTVDSLLKNFDYFSEPFVNRELSTLYKAFISGNNITDENTVYTFLKSKDGQTNSSNDYWTLFKAINSINKNICYVDISTITKEQWEYIDNIVFVDDISGSGKTVKTELENKKEIFKGKTIHLITVCIMNNAIAKLKEYAEMHKFSINVFSNYCFNKVFSRTIFDDNNNARKQIKDMSESLLISNDYIFGFKKSEALVAFYNNTPNNTLGFFWCNTPKYTSLFPRKQDKKPFWQELKSDKKERTTENYNSEIQMVGKYE